MPDLVPVDYNPFVGGSSVDPLVKMGGLTPVQIAAVPQDRANMLLGALGPLGEAGMTVGDWLRTGGSSFDTRDIAPVAAGIMMGTAAPEADETVPLASVARRMAQSDFGALRPSQDWITQWARQYGAGQHPTRGILDEWARQNNIPIKWDMAQTGSGYAIIGDPSVKTPSGAAGHYVKVRFSDHAPVYNAIGEPNFIDSNTVDSANLIDALNWKFGTNLVGDTPKMTTGAELWPTPSESEPRGLSKFDKQVEYATSLLEQYPELGQRDYSQTGRVNLMGKKIEGWAFDMAIRNARESGQLGLRLTPVDYQPNFSQ